MTYQAKIGGQYHILAYNDPGTSGEYFLQVRTPRYASGSIIGRLFGDLNGNGMSDNGDPGLANWEVDVYASKGAKVASQMTQAGGAFDIVGLALGTYTVKEVLRSGWTQTAPAAPGTFAVNVTAGRTVSGLTFGDFQNVTISGQLCNDLDGDGAAEPDNQGSEPVAAQLSTTMMDAVLGLVGSQVRARQAIATDKIAASLFGGDD